MYTVLVITQPDDLQCLAWANYIAQRTHRKLQVLCLQKANAPRFEEVTALPDAAADPASDLLQQTFGALAAFAEPRPRLFDCRGTDLRRAALSAVSAMDAGQIIIPLNLDQTGAAPDPGPLRQLALSAPYDVLLLQPGGPEPSPGRVVLPLLSGKAGYALRLAARLMSGSDGEVRVLPDPERPAAAARQYRRIQALVADRTALTLADVAAHDSLLETLRQQVANGDLILFDAAGGGQLRAWAKALRSLRKELPQMPIAIGIARSADAAGPGRFERWVERVRRMLPSLSRDERKDLYQRLERSGVFSVDFMIMLAISTAIAALGLIQNSTAVVIGAMLVAPLMTPLIAIGMALAQHNYQLFRSALQASAAGIAAALLVATLLGALSPWGDLSAEVVARGSPNLFDLGIALLSGIAAAYALARPGLAGTLVGVAIAVALVPPLAAVGISLAHREYAVSLGALTLFTTNFFAIILGAALVFRFFARNAERAEPRPQWVRSSAALFGLGLLTIILPLVHNLTAQTHEGVHRPYARPLPPGLRAELQQLVGATPGVKLVQMAHSDIEHGFGIQVILASDAGPQPDLVATIERRVVEQMGPRLPVSVFVLGSAQPKGR